jgi:uncharacterized repeat protein (TIGR03803 family)
MVARLLTLQAEAAYSSMYVFGDSLSAVSGGGMQYPPPLGTSVDNYWNGRFSNGRVWVEYLADLQGITLNTNNDFSWFGGGSGSIQKTLVSGNFYPPPDFATSLCIFWPACSDCFALALFAGTNSWSPTLAELGSYETATVGLLYTQGMGTVLIPNGSGFQVLHTFTNNSVDGVNPYAGLILGADGFLYGTTQRGGTNGSGTVFKLSTSGSGYRVIYNFGSVTNDGQYPTGPVIQGSDGYLYGTTPYGGAFGLASGGYRGYGVAFKLDATGSSYTVLYNFGGSANDGRNPQGGLAQSPDGALYGTTSAGGDLNAGTVFRLGPAPFQFISCNRLPDNKVSLLLYGSSNTTCRIDASTDLVNWDTLATLPDTNGSVQFIDTAAPSFPHRFYRAFQGP